MLYSVPDYYREFHCTAAACEDTCCAGWQIAADPDSLNRYKKVRGPFRRQILRGVDFKNGVFRQKTGKRCAFLNNENLCDLYTVLGEKSLCRTCHLYPRHIEEFEGVREITLSLSCPEVARILMNRTEPARFRTVERPGTEEYEIFDPFLYSQLLDARDVIRSILQNRGLELSVRAALVYGIARDMQRRVDQKELFSCGEVLEKYQKPAAELFVRKKIAQNQNCPDKMFSFAKKQFRCMHRLELLRKEWEYLLLETEKRMFLNHDAVEYQSVCREFQAWTDQNGLPWKIQKEQILVYLIDTYFCGAVYDGAILPKAQMALFCADILEILLIARWLRNEKQLDTDDVIELVCRFSREVEHSDRNLRQMETMMPIRNERFL